MYWLWSCQDCTNDLRFRTRTVGGGALEPHGEEATKAARPSRRHHVGTEGEEASPPVESLRERRATNVCGEERD
jgi:hypothetical protein